MKGKNPRKNIQIEPIVCGFGTDLKYHQIMTGTTETRFQILEMVNLGVILMPNKDVSDFHF